MERFLMKNDSSLSPCPYVRRRDSGTESVGGVAGALRGSSFAWATTAGCQLLQTSLPTAHAYILHWKIPSCQIGAPLCGGMTGRQYLILHPGVACYPLMDFIDVSDRGV